MSSRRLALTAGPAAVTVLAAVLVLAPMPAHADSRTTRDASRDVVSQPLDDDSVSVREPQRVEGDVLSMRVTHGKKAVRIKLRAAQLTRMSARYGGVYAFGIRTNEGRRADLSITAGGRPWQGTRLWMVDDQERTCRGLRTHIGYRSDTVRVVIPRRCLSNPRWVRVGGGVGTISGGRLHADDAGRNGTMGDDFAFGPRIRR